MLFDTHVHFDGLDDRPEEVVERALRAGVGRMLAVGGSPEGNRTALETAARFPQNVRAAVGFDREWVGRYGAARELAALIGNARPRVAAVGEIGVDLHYHPENAQAQTEWMAEMLATAAEAALPVVVHSRNAEQATLELLRGHAAGWKGEGPVGVLHCFTGTQETARRLVDLGYMIGFSGIVSFRSAAGLRAVAARVPENRILLETDAPYLAPVPCRGQPNEPAWLPHVLAALAAARNADPAALGAQTWRNACRLFGWE